MKVKNVLVVVACVAAGACKARQPGAQVRDTGAGAGVEADAGEELSQLAREMEADLGEVFAMAAPAPGRDGLALDDAPERVLTPQELDDLKRQAAELSGQYRRAVARVDRAAEERAARIAHLSARLDAATRALKGIDPNDTERYALGISDVRRVFNELQAAAGTLAPPTSTAADPVAVTPTARPVPPTPQVPPAPVQPATPAQPPAPVQPATPAQPSTPPPAVVRAPVSNPDVTRCTTLPSGGYAPLSTAGKAIAGTKPGYVDLNNKPLPGFSDSACRRLVNRAGFGVVCSMGSFDNWYSGFRSSDGADFDVPYQNLENCLTDIQYGVNDLVCVQADFGGYQFAAYARSVSTGRYKRFEVTPAEKAQVRRIGDRIDRQTNSAFRACYDWIKSDEAKTAFDQFRR